ncbi:hypothetical protein M8C21_023012 [Ambrosia artemisiifolia]|jgi:sorting nexin-1/2
MNSKD